MISDIMRENGFTHSYVKALKAGSANIVDLPIEMYATLSGFALRTVVHKDLCPSAMSVFDWELLSKAAEDIGFKTKVITRSWDEDHLELEKRTEAHQVIIDSKNPIITWDVSVPEWEIITAFDAVSNSYAGISVKGDPINLPIGKLGRREIPVLFVMELTSWKKPTNITQKLLQIIINHNEGNEAIATPDYLEGYQAYDHWIEKMKAIAEDDWDSRYYFETYSIMKKHASKYFQSLLTDDNKLIKLSKYFDDLAALFEQLLEQRKTSSYPKNKNEIIKNLQKAKELEYQIYTEAKNMS